MTAVTAALSGKLAVAITSATPTFRAAVVRPTAPVNPNHMAPDYPASCQTKNYHEIDPHKADPSDFCQGPVLQAHD